MEEYKVSFEFMFRFVEVIFENYPENEQVQMIYDQFFVIRKELENGSKKD